jgi:hypothetical protein
MSFEEIPDHLIRINVSARFSNDPLWKILMAAGPGVSATFDDIEDNFRTFLTFTV